MFIITLSLYGIEFVRQARLVNFASNFTTLRQFWKISRTVLLLLIASIIATWLLVQTTPVQNLLVSQVAKKLSGDLHTTVRINHVNFALFNSMLLQGTLVEDHQKDTLLYAGTVKVNITDWFFFRDKIELSYIGLQDAVVHLNRSDSVWNYQFLIDYFSGPATPGKKKNINLDLRRIEFDNIELVQQDRWRGEDMRAAIKALELEAEEINFNKRLIRIHTVDLDQPYFHIYNYPGKRVRPAVSAVEEEPILNDPANLRWNPGGWDLQIGSLRLHNGTLQADRQTDRQPYESFDGQHILFGEITGSLNGIRLLHDTLTTSVQLATRERSGFEVKELKAVMKVHPEAMEFSDLLILTGESRLHNFFAMRYSSIEDMNDFETKVRMEGNFDNAMVSSNDIAYFAPALKDWNKKILILGTVKGSVDKLSGRDLVVQAGNDTYLKGDIRLDGLPDINTTYIDFDAENFRTTYADAVSIIPALKKVSQPRLDLLEFLRFKGNFTGFITDFVTYGSLETKLGTVVTDLNMKLPGNRPEAYSGNIRSNGFAIGALFGNSRLGRIVFRGRVDGTGLNATDINAALDGNIDLVEFNGYPYQGITIKGNVANRLFNGELIAADPNLAAQLNGLVDFSKDIPEFNFEATVTNAHLQQLNLLKEQVDFYGKFLVNFTGDNIDNFLGTARVYDASLYRRGKKISFDSLNIESRVIDSNKVITAISNEFDAALAGEFSVNDLPAAFASFLNKYYPSYIKPSQKTLNNENFSFVITTKNVEEYIGLIDTALTGFNYSTLTGRINTKENLLDLNAEVPQFSYRNMSVYDLALKARGTYDSLSVESEIANVYINDSLNFPHTSVRIRSAKDISEVNIQTSANQTLNSANIAATVETLPKGARIQFRESGFDVNGKTWTIEKNGELVLTEDLVTANRIRLYNGLQEISVTSVPSNSGKTNDLVINLEQVILGDFTPYLVPSNRLEGLLSGSVHIIDPLGNLRIDMKGEAQQFRLDNDSIGKISLRSKYYQELREIDFNAVSDNQDYHFEIQGIYSLPDSTRAEKLDIFTNLEKTRIDHLQQYLSGVFSDVTGYATGALRISGPANDPDYTGSILLSDAQLKVKYTNVLYHIPNANIELKEDRIDFGSFSFQDDLHNTAKVTRGILYHDGFNNLSFDFAMNTNKLLVLATGNGGADPYYGTVIAKANMAFRGPLEDMQLDIIGEPADSSSLYINTRSGKESGLSDFVVWKEYGREMQSTRRFDESNLTVNLDVTANNYANMYVIIDELTGDIIQANGRGNLKIHATTNGEFSITGRYDIDRGNYNFNFGSLLRKPFRLRQGVSNYIQWSGDPDDAIIKIDAEYEAENVRFSDLYTNIREDVNANVSRYRGKVLVIASLTEQLQSPMIRFQIELPASSPLKNDVDALRILNQIQNDENELNKQAAFLVVLNSFGPLQTTTQAGLANTAFEGIVVGSISGVLSNTLSHQFSNVFQKIFNDKSIQVNFNAQLYSGSNFVNTLNRNPFNIDRTNLNLSIAKSLFNERLTFTFGSAVDFGLTSTQLNATRNLPFLPDLNAEWRITPDGRLVLTFFYRDSYNYLYLSEAGVLRRNRSGASISYRKEFEMVGDLFRKEDE